ncbi:MAG: hypothetical protein P8010_13460 [Desulfosarcinaceae bacterium]|jgi:hypothetical protein
MRKWISTGAIVLALVGGMLFSACEGTDTREEVDTTVETVVGKEQIDQFKEAKEKIGAVEAQQSERYKALEEEE